MADALRSGPSRHDGPGGELRSKWEGIACGDAQDGFRQPSAGTRCADAVNHSFIASVQASQWGVVAYSPASRPRPLGPRQGGAFRVARRAEAAQELGGGADRSGRATPH